MRVGELSRRSGVPIPTIKYYLREGLLPAGAATAANQADYTEEHLRRLGLIRALIDVGGVSVAGARNVIDALADPHRAPHDLLGDAQAAIAPKHRPDRHSPAWAAARARVVEMIDARGWLIYSESPEIDRVADVLAACAALDVAELLDNFDVYASGADALAAVEVGAVLARPEPASRLELVVLGTILGEALFSSLRMLAHQHESAKQLGPVLGTGPDGFAVGQV